MNDYNLDGLERIESHGNQEEIPERSGDAGSYHQEGGEVLNYGAHDGHQGYNYGDQSADGYQNGYGQQDHSNHQDGNEEEEQVHFQAGEKGKEILIMTVEIGDGRRDNIHVFENDRPEDLALEFCHRHGLNEKLQDALTQHIQSNIEQVLNDQKSEGDIHSGTGNRSGHDGYSRQQYDSPSPDREYDGYYARPKSSGPIDRRELQKLEEAKQRGRSPQGRINQTGEGRDYYEYWQREIENTYQPSSSQHNPQINEKSRRIMEQRYAGKKVNVHDRLHQQAQIKNKMKQNLEQTETSFNTSTKKTTSDKKYLNIGHRLYMKGLKKREETERAIAEAKVERKKKEESGLTFRPVINENAHELAKRSYEPPEFSLIQRGRTAAEKKEKAKAMKLQMEMKDCSFKPQITKMSERIINEKKKTMTDISAVSASASASERDFNKDNFAQLYDEAQRRRDRQQHVYDNCIRNEFSFRPDIGTNKYRPKSDHNDKEFLERLVNSRKDTEETLREMRKKQSEPKDPKTGQPFFKPQTGRAPAKSRNTAALPIGEYLFSTRVEMENMKKKMVEEEDKKWDSVSKQRFSDDSSEKILQNMKERRLKDIFTTLDHDGDNVISANKIDISGLPTDLLEVLTPLFCEMEESDQTLNFDEFYDASDRLINRLNVHDRAILLKSRREVQVDDPKFQPEVNAKSKRLAEKKRPQGADLYNTLLSEKKNKEDKLKQKQQEKWEKEVEDCTFQPKLFKPNLNLNMENSMLRNQSLLRDFEDDANEDGVDADQSGSHGRSQEVDPHQLSG